MRQDSAWRRNGVKGPTVKYIYFKETSGRGTTLTQQRDGTWTLEGSLGYETGLKEAFRDEWSVYFSTVPKFSNGRSMSADLWRGEIRFKPSSSSDWNSAVGRYKITLADTSAPTKPWLRNGAKGRTAKYIYFKRSDNKEGSLTLERDGSWTLEGDLGYETGLREASRDEWSVYFPTGPKFANGKRMAADLWKGQLRFKSPGGGEGDSQVGGYTITLADTSAPTKPWLKDGVKGRTVKRIRFRADGRSGSLRQSADGRWRLRGKFGRASRLEESGRDEWSVYFSSIPNISEGEKVVADLWTGTLRSGSRTYKISYADAGKA